ncbi:hypothetical protein P3L10_024653 [Capsicum annuum]
MKKSTMKLPQLHCVELFISSQLYKLLMDIGLLKTLVLSSIFHLWLCVCISPGILILYFQLNIVRKFFAIYTVTRYIT